MGKGAYKEVYFDGIHIGYGNLELSKNTHLHFESEFETVEMHFALNGETITDPSYFDGTIRFVPGTHNVFYTNGFQGKTAWSSKIPLRMFEINMAPKVFQKYIPEGHHLFDIFKEAMFSKKSAVLSRQNYPITIEMYKIISEILNCSRDGLFKRIFLESKLISLLLLQLEQIVSFNTQNAYQAINKEDMEKMYAVK